MPSRKIIQVSPGAASLKDQQGMGVQGLDRQSVAVRELPIVRSADQTILNRRALAEFDQFVGCGQADDAEVDFPLLQ
ncbi:hypothetical protein D3C83_213900 [compost metagenome]